MVISGFSEIALSVHTQPLPSTVHADPRWLKCHEVPFRLRQKHLLSSTGLLQFHSLCNFIFLSCESSFRDPHCPSFSFLLYQILLKLLCRLQHQLCSVLSVYSRKLSSTCCDFVTVSRHWREEHCLSLLATRVPSETSSTVTASFIPKCTEKGW